MAGIALAEAGGYRFLSQEVKQTAFRLDGVIEPPENGPDAPRAYIEVQFQPDEGFYPRFFREILLHLGQYPARHSWHAVAVYPSRAVERTGKAIEPLLELPNLHRVYLDSLPLLDSANPALWLIGLIVAEFENIPPIVDRIKEHQATATDGAIDWMELLETVLVYKLPAFTREEIRKMLNFEDVELRQTRFYQDVFAEGEAKGKAMGEAAVLLRLLQRKFGPLSPAALSRVERADAETLLVWAERVLDANSLDEVWGH